MSPTAEQEASWQERGFFVIPAFVAKALGRQMAEETIAQIRADPPAAHLGMPAYETTSGLVIQPEAQPMIGTIEAEDSVSKVFNTHLAGAAHDFAVSERCGDIAAALLGGDVDVFQSMFILKNPGAWGQPWHQDSHYFNFDTTPQIGLWLAISEATLENGCLSVLPGSHRREVLEHVTDRRPGANQGYLEVLNLDETAAIPVLMQPGDLLVFHSHLLHRSVDNKGAARRLAMVYHYAPAGTRNLAPDPIRAMQDKITHWIPAKRSAKEVA
jgi:phytanoyl-CoA hydroxylase